MLTAMHEASKNWLGKIVLGFLFALLILSFAVWGIGDIFRGFGSGTVAKAGDIEIPTEEYRAEYQTLLQNYQRNAKRVITNDQARALGIDKLVLNRMISEGLIEAEDQGSRMNLNTEKHDKRRQINAVPCSPASQLENRRAAGAGQE